MSKFLFLALSASLAFVSGAPALADQVFVTFGSAEAPSPPPYGYFIPSYAPSAPESPAAPISPVTPLYQSGEIYEVPVGGAYEENLYGEPEYVEPGFAVPQIIIGDDHHDHNPFAFGHDEHNDHHP